MWTTARTGERHRHSFGTGGRSDESGVTVCRAGFTGQTCPVVEKIANWYANHRVLQRSFSAHSSHFAIPISEGSIQSDESSDVCHLFDPVPSTLGFPLNRQQRSGYTSRFPMSVVIDGRMPRLRTGVRNDVDH